jgi:hypothetical protein
MSTKLKNLLLILDNDDIQAFSELITTKIMSGNKKHQAFFTHYIQNQDTQNLKVIPVADRLLMSDLCKMIEKFLVMKHASNSAHYFDMTLMSLYRINENEKLFNDILQNAQKREKQNHKNADHYAETSEIYFEKWQFDQLKNRFGNTEADDIIFMEDISLISKKLKQTVILAPQSALISKKINTEFIDFIEPYIIEKKYLDYPCISVFYYAIKMLFHPDQIHWFEEFNHVLSSNENHFSTEELKTLYFQAINYCIRKHNLGNKEFSKKLLEYYITALEKRYLLTNGFLSKNTYRNINTIAIRMGKYEEATKITSDNAKFLRKEEKESAYQFNLANIHYAKHEYDLALHALRIAEFDDHLSNLFAKTLMLKIYYETKETRLLDSHLDAMQVYLTRKKIIGYHKTNYSNIVKYTRKLIRLKPYDQKAKEKLAESIRNEKLLPDRDWLLRQVG